MARFSIRLALASSLALVAVAAPSTALAVETHQKLQWSLTAKDGINAESVWSITKGAGTTVGVIDTGVSAAPKDLKGAVKSAKSFSGGPAADKDGHGTMVAGIIAARENNYGIMGIAPEANIVSGKVFNKKGEASDKSINEAIKYMAAKKVRIVNVSLGGEYRDKNTAALIEKNKDILFVVAAGNEKWDVDKRKSYPCSFTYDNVICVGAISKNGSIASISNYGQRSVDLYAPGTNIVSTYLPDGKRDRWSQDKGTSYSAPMVSATAALILSVDDSLSAKQIKHIILDSTVKDKRYKDKSVSGGRLDTYAAVVKAQAKASTPAPAPAPGPAPAPQPGPTPTPDPGTNNPGSPQPQPEQPQPQPVTPVVEYVEDLQIGFFNMLGVSHGFVPSVAVYDYGFDRKWDALPTYTYEWCPVTNSVRFGSNECAASGITIPMAVGGSNECAWAEHVDATAIPASYFVEYSERGIWYEFRPSGGNLASVRIKATGTMNGRPTTIYGPAHEPNKFSQGDMRYCSNNPGGGGGNDL